MSCDIAILQHRILMCIELATILGCVDSRKSACRQQVLPPEHHHGSVTIALADELAISVRRHPVGSGEMAVMDTASPLRFALGIEPEEDLDDFAPVGAIRRGIEQAQIELHVLTIIARKHRARRRFVEEFQLNHRVPRDRLAPVDPILATNPGSILI